MVFIELAPIIARMAARLAGSNGELL